MPPEGNGDYLSRFERLERLAEQNLQDQEKIWQSIAALRDSQAEMTSGIKGLISAIRDLIDRIPPENLR